MELVPAEVILSGAKVGEVVTHRTYLDRIVDSMC